MEKKIPPCAASDHPEGFDRTRGMVIVQETADHVVFGCRICNEMNRTCPIQVRSFAHGRVKARYMNQLRDVERARNVVKKIRKISYSGGPLSG
jgi:hypothetical protein